MKIEQNYLPQEDTQHFLLLSKRDLSLSEIEAKLSLSFSLEERALLFSAQTDERKRSPSLSQTERQSSISLSVSFKEKQNAPTFSQKTNLALLQKQNPGFRFPME